MSECCFVCCEKFDLKDKKKVDCNNPSCNFSACKTCNRNYLMNNINDIHCMNCRQSWDQTFVIINLNRNWYNDVYKIHRKELLFQSEQSKFSETMPHVEKYHKIISLQDKIKENEAKANKLREMLQEINTVNMNINRDIRVIKTGKEEDAKRKKFIMPCQKENCKGFLSSHYKCGVCQDYCCSRCLDVVGPLEALPDHECDQGKIATAEFIKSNTKPCPNCGTRIHKINGCDQMWCTSCKTAFSWNKGEILNGTVHNPHYFQYMRDRNNGVIPRQPGDNPCNDPVPTLTSIIFACHVKFYGSKFLKIAPVPGENLVRNHTHKELYFKEKEEDDWKISPFRKFHNDCEIILSAFQVFSHIQFVEIPAIRNTLDTCNDTVQERVQFIINNIDKNKFMQHLMEKDTKKSKSVDLMYIYDLIINVGKDTLKKIFSIIDNKMHLSRQEIIIYLSDKSNTEILEAFSNCVNEIKKFIDYCNIQFDTISVSHNCNVKHIKLIKRQYWASFRNIPNISEFVIMMNKDVDNYRILSGYLLSDKYELKSQRKSTIKKIKATYNKN